MKLPIIERTESPRRLPSWLRQPLPRGNGDHFTRRTLDQLGLVTVCDEARCPNRMECYAHRTATFMILGDTCTRACGFCSVARGTPVALDRLTDEPDRLAEAVVRLGLEHVVITSVSRDDLPDGGAAHFVRCIEAVRRRTDATVEVLTPDFLDKPGAVELIAGARPEVFNHNTETVPRLYTKVRGPRSRYAWTLELLRRVKELAPSTRTKSGLMLGMGETTAEVLDVLADLRTVDCDLLTLGQYLQPDPQRYLPVVRYVPPAEFDWWKHRALGLGFHHVASGPFVRSSYHAREMVAGGVGAGG